LINGIDQEHRRQGVDQNQSSSAPYSDAGVIQSSHTQFGDPKVVPDNIQPWLCITVMAGNDMEKRVELRVYFTLLLLFESLSVRSSRACRKNEGNLKVANMGNRARMPGS
jgi:hypothetical protein